MGERRRIAGERPWRLRCVIGVPDRRDEDGAAADRVVDRARLDTRERVALGTERIAQAADRQVDDARTGIDRPTDGLGFVAHVDRLIGARDLGDDQLCGKSHAGDALVVVDGCRDHSCDEGAVALLIGVRPSPDPAPGQPDPGAELRVTAVDARVDDRHAHRVHDWKLRREGIEGVVLSEVVLLRGERVSRDEPGAKRHAQRRPAPGQAPAPPEQLSSRGGDLEHR